MKSNHIIHDLADTAAGLLISLHNHQLDDLGFASVSN